MTITIYKKEDCQIEECDGEYVFYDETKGQIAVLNRSAGALWSLMNVIEDHDELLNKYHDVFVDPPVMDVFQQDYDRILACFFNIGLVRIKIGNDFIEKLDINVHEQDINEMET